MDRRAPVCPLCNKNDYLPSPCMSCHKVFCKDHFEKRKHNCAITVDRRAPVCPLCNKPLGIHPSETPDEVVNRHISRGCKDERANSGYKCSHAKCKNKKKFKVAISRMLSILGVLLHVVITFHQFKKLYINKKFLLN